MEKVLNYISGNGENFENQLKEFLKIPSISTNPENVKDMRTCAEFVEKEMNSVGLENVKIMDTPGHPVVYGEWLHAGEDKPTILIYGHYDVQPVDPVELWTDPPFSANIKEGKIYARGAVDDKGQVFIHFKSLESHMKNN
jgi:acetylornithine deacetylase/succinyl-diaminopimelate desuccinylase-like protein